MSFDNYDELRVRAENQRTVIERELCRDNADSTTNIIGIILCSVAYLAFFFVVFNINQITLILSIATAVAYGYYIYLIASSSYVNRQYKDALVSYQNQNQRIISEIDAARFGSGGADAGVFAHASSEIDRIDDALSRVSRVNAGSRNSIKMVLFFALGISIAVLVCFVEYGFFVSRVSFDSDWMRPATLIFSVILLIAAQFIAQRFFYAWRNFNLTFVSFPILFLSILLFIPLLYLVRLLFIALAIIIPVILGIAAVIFVLFCLSESAG